MRKRMTSLLLTLVMLLSLLPTTALAASPDASNVFVNGNINFYNPTRLYYKNGDSDASFTGTSTDFNAAYDPATGTLTLKDYNGKGITVGGVGRTDITVVLKGTNIINDGSLENAVGGDITVTSDSSGTLSISKTTSGSNPAIGIETGLSASYTTGNVTIKGNAKVTINVTHNGTSTYEKAYGIFAKQNITISENASVDITCATPNNTTGGDNCNGLYAAKDVTIDTNGTIKIDVTKAGKDDGYSFGVYPMGTATLTKVGEMEVQWKKHATHSSFPGGAVYKGASLSDTDYAINVDETNCYASYRKGTPYTVTVENGTLTGTGVKHANGSGNFLAGDKVNITPAIKKSWDDQEIPFKEWTSSDVTLDKSATTASNFFTVPGKDVTVTAKHSPFAGTPKFTPTGTTGTQGTLTFKTVVKADDAYEGFRLVKEGDENNESSYISIRSDTTSTSSPYEYSHETSIYSLNEGNYYVVAYLNNHYYLGEKFTVSYTAPTADISVSGIIKSYNPNNATTIQLMQGGKEKYKTTIAPASGSSQEEQNFSFDAVAKGTYDLVVTKPGHLSYTVKGVVVVGDGPLDLTKHSNAAISTITLLCGDIDGNGFINSTDLGIILKGQNYGKSTATAGDKAADLDGNGFINSTDLGIVLQGQHYGKSAVSVNFGG